MYVYAHVAHHHTQANRHMIICVLRSGSSVNISGGLWLKKLSLNKRLTFAQMSQKKKKKGNDN